MTIPFIRLDANPSATALQLIDTCALQLAPAEHALVDWHGNYVANHRARIAQDLDIITREIPRSSRILECGSIPLLLTTALVHSGYQVTGCDIAPERYSTAIDSAGLHVVKCNIETEKLPFASDSFDAAIFNELFEHLRIDPIFTLTELLRVLKPGGMLTLSTPNLKSLGGIKNFLLEGKAYSCSAEIYPEYQKLRKLGHMGHVREYTTTEVVEFLKTIGFDVGVMLFRGQYARAPAQALIRLVPRLSPFVSYVARKPVSRA